MDIECGLDRTSEGVEVFADSPSGERHRIARCIQRGKSAEVGHVHTEFRVPEPGNWRLSAVHKASSGEGAQAHVTWTMDWRLGSAWFPLGGVVTLLALGLICLGLYPLARVFGLQRLEQDFEAARAELLLSLRRRRDGAPQDSPSNPAPEPTA